MEEKKKRGSNYTHFEKDILLHLVNKHKDIIENKETNSSMILTKRNTWILLCNEYNKVSVSGQRTWVQLRHLYENLKQRTKKNYAEYNRLQSQDPSEENKWEAIIDKKEICLNGSGPYKSLLTEHDVQILAMAPQIKSLSDDENITNNEIMPLDVLEIQTDNNDNQEPSNSPALKDSLMNETSTASNSDNQEPSNSLPSKDSLVNKPSTPSNPGERRAKKLISKNDCNELKRAYFRAKLRNANYEYKCSPVLAMTLAGGRQRDVECGRPRPARHRRSAGSATRQSLHARGTDSVDPLRCKRLTQLYCLRRQLLLRESSRLPVSTRVPVTLLKCYHSPLSDASGHFFCGDIDGVPLGQRGVLPGPTQIKCGRLSESTRGTHAAGIAPRHPIHSLYVAHTPTASLNRNPAADRSLLSLSVAGAQPRRNRNKTTYVTRLIPY